MGHQELDEALGLRLRKVERSLQVVVVAWLLSMVVLVLLGVAVQKATSQSAILRAREFHGVPHA